MASLVRTITAGNIEYNSAQKLAKLAQTSQNCYDIGIFDND